MKLSEGGGNVYAARVPESEADVAEALLDAQFDALQREKDDDDDSWDIAAFSKISVVTTNGGVDDDDVRFDADFPDAFDFADFGGTRDVLDNVPEEEEEKEEDEYEEEEEEEEEEAESPTENDPPKQYPEPEVDSEVEDLVEASPASSEEEPPQRTVSSPPIPFVIDDPLDSPIPTVQSRDEAEYTGGIKTTNVSSASADVWAGITDIVSPIALVVKSFDTGEDGGEEKPEDDKEEKPEIDSKSKVDPPSSSGFADMVRATSPLAFVMKSFDTVEEDGEEKAADGKEKLEPEGDSKSSNVVSPAPSFSDIVRSTSPFSFVMKSFDSIDDDEARNGGDSHSVPSIELSSVDSDSIDGHDDEDAKPTLARRLARAEAETRSGAKSPSRILNFFAKKKRNGGSIKMIKSGSRDKTQPVSPSKSTTSKDMSASSKDKKSSNKLKLASFRRKEKEENLVVRKGAKNVKKDESYYSTENDVTMTTDCTESSPERQTRVYKIMRKKSSRRRDSSSNDQNTSFLEDFADEFFTCTYFFKLLGELGKGSDEPTPCCGAPQASYDPLETVEDQELALTTEEHEPSPEDAASCTLDPPGTVASS